VPVRRLILLLALVLCAARACNPVFELRRAGCALGVSACKVIPPLEPSPTVAPSAGLW